MRNVEAKKRQNAVLGLLQGKGGLVSILDYTYDTQKERWCELTLSFSVSRKAVDMSNIVRKSAERAVLHEIKNIKGSSHHKRDAHEEIVTNFTTSANFWMKFDIRLLELCHG